MKWKITITTTILLNTQFNIKILEEMLANAFQPNLLWRALDQLDVLMISWKYKSQYDTLSQYDTSKSSFKLKINMLINTRSS